MHVPFHNLREGHLEEAVEELFSDEHHCKLHREFSDARVIKARVPQIGSVQHLATKLKSSIRFDSKRNEKHDEKMAPGILIETNKTHHMKPEKRGNNEELTGALKNA